MRAPSARVLNDTVNIFVGIPVQDSEGGLQWTYPSAPTLANVPCSVQYQDCIVESQNERLTTINTYWIVFGIPVIQVPRMSIAWIDETGMNHTLYADGLPPSEAGRGGPYTIRAIEKI